MKMQYVNNKYNYIFLLVFFITSHFCAVSAHALKKESEKLGGIIILLQQELKAPFQLSSYNVLLDGKTVLEKRLGGTGLSGITINGLPEGKYNINVSALYSGSGYGLFEYHEDYKYPLESTTEIKVEEGKVTSLKIICNDRDGFLSDLDKRPYITYHTSSIKFPHAPDGKDLAADLDNTINLTEKANKLEGEKRISEIGLPIEGKMAQYLTGLSVEKDDNLKLLVLADGVMKDYRSMRLDKPDRIVIDIEGVREQLKIDSLQINSPLVKKVRVGQHPGYTRVVLDTPGKPRLDYDIKPTKSGLIVNIYRDNNKAVTSDEKLKNLRKAKHLTGISVEKVINGVRVFLAGDGSFGDYTSRLIEKPDRLVLDIKGVKELLDIDKLPVNSTLLKAVRIGQHPGMLRLVLDLPGSTEIKYDIKALSDGLLVEVLKN